MPIKDKQKRKEYFKNYMRKIREKLRIDKKKAENRQIEREIRMGNVNFGLGYETEPFMSWERFKEIWGDLATIDSYKKEKKQFLEDRRKDLDEIKKTPLGEILLSVPMKGEDCRKFRLAHMNVIQGIERTLAIENHLNCKWCGEWFAYNKKKGNIGKISGVDVWHPERNTSTKRYSDEQLQEMLEEEMRKMGH